MMQLTILAFFLFVSSSNLFCMEREEITNNNKQIVVYQPNDFLINPIISNDNNYRVKYQHGSYDHYVKRFNNEILQKNLDHTYMLAATSFSLINKWIVPHNHISFFFYDVYAPYFDSITFGPYIYFAHRNEQEAAGTWRNLDETVRYLYVLSDMTKKGLTIDIHAKDTACMRVLSTYLMLLNPTKYHTILAKAGIEIKDCPSILNQIKTIHLIDPSQDSIRSTTEIISQVSTTGTIISGVNRKTYKLSDTLVGQFLPSNMRLPFEIVSMMSQSRIFDIMYGYVDPVTKTIYDNAVIPTVHALQPNICSYAIVLKELSQLKNNINKLYTPRILMEIKSSVGKNNNYASLFKDLPGNTILFKASGQTSNVYKHFGLAYHATMFEDQTDIKQNICDNENEVEAFLTTHNE